MTRIALLASAAIFATLAPAAAQDLTPVTFGTNWLPQGEHGGYYQAIADGDYEACGLDVTIVPGGPQVNNRAMLLAGRIQFHMGGNLLQAFSAAEQDIPLKVVAAHFQKEPQILMSHPDEGFDTFESLKDATLFIGDPGFQSYYQWMIDQYGFEASQRQPYTFNPAPFIANKKSAQQGYVTSEPFAVEREGGFKPNIFLLADYGFDSYATTVETMADTVENSPEVVQCFVDASAKGWYKYMYGDNSAANALIQAANPDMTDEQLAFSHDSMMEFGILESGTAEADGIGAMTDEKFTSFHDKMVAAGVVPDGVDISDIYTLEFVNKGVGLDIKKELTGQ
ncbi:ABC transporter substrate-binding protein [Acuticoccus sp. MNP-M23]|uniref:ABC transporter substrate-binding protein n=1 Tax=Acuticoccus sp. MNP-M23 TaxID=3072793 RepID=UPI002814E715|nr:ABC transporter substrate-binding protein [Acuticoccus sp. MNP-M23]WMS42768.1 ABC transporter substrate-binding protein [Acuticoccus sp. MNP-M23]